MKAITFSILHCCYLTGRALKQKPQCRSGTDYAIIGERWNDIKRSWIKNFFIFKHRFSIPIICWSNFTFCSILYLSQRGRMPQNKRIYMKELFLCNTILHNSTSTTDVMPLIIDVSTKSLSQGLENLFCDEMFLYTASSFHVFGTSSTIKGNESPKL